jgi:RsiW-degrading membrane proteinase PrsW (M82 family)
MNVDPFIYALLGGILPAFLWLLFWLREDWKHPEPNRLILRTFLFGMLSVGLAIPLQQWASSVFANAFVIQIILWALIEESFKFLSAYFGGIHSVSDNEPVDPLVYMLTAALGFVAIENTLFILNPLLESNVMESLVTGNMRFVGASLLHVVSSGITGAFLSYSFYKSKRHKWRAVFHGLFWATLFHASFNLLILYKNQAGLTAAFLAVWVGVVVLLWTFERVKALRPPLTGL